MNQIKIDKTLIAIIINTVSYIDAAPRGSNTVRATADPRRHAPPYPCLLAALVRRLRCVLSVFGRVGLRCTCDVGS